MARDPSILSSHQPTAIAPSSVNIAHVQLRDLLICPREAGLVNYVHSRSIVEQNLHAPGAPLRTLSHLSFASNSLTSLQVNANDTLIAAGGQESEIHLSLHTPSSSSSRSHSASRSPSHGSSHSPAPSTRRLWDFEDHLTGSINNSVLLTSLSLTRANESSVEPRVGISNNDGSVKLYDVPMRVQNSRRKLAEVGVVRLDVPINHSSISPDGRTLLSVGDSNKIYFHRITGGSSITFSPITTLTIPPPDLTPFSPYPSSYAPAPTYAPARTSPPPSYGYAYDPTANPSSSLAASFSTAFSGDGSKFAVSSQEGVVAVWDVRSTKPLKIFQTDKTRVPGRYGGATGWLSDDPWEWTRGTKAPGWCVRSVKFNQGEGARAGREVMAFTEHTSFIHIVDARTFETDELIRVPTLTHHQAQAKPKPTTSSSLSSLSSSLSSTSNSNSFTSSPRLPPFAIPPQGSSRSRNGSPTTQSTRPTTGRRTARTRPVLTTPTSNVRLSDASSSIAGGGGGGAQGGAGGASTGSEMSTRDMALDMLRRLRGDARLESDVARASTRTSTSAGVRRLSPGGFGTSAAGGAEGDGAGVAGSTGEGQGEGQGENEDLVIPRGTRASDSEIRTYRLALAAMDRRLESRRRAEAALGLGLTAGAGVGAATEVGVAMGTGTGAAPGFRFVSGAEYGAGVGGGVGVGNDADVEALDGVSTSPRSSSLYYGLGRHPSSSSRSATANPGSGGGTTTTRNTSTAASSNFSNSVQALENSFRISLPTSSSSASHASSHASSHSFSFSPSLSGSGSGSAGGGGGGGGGAGTHTRSRSGLGSGGSGSGSGSGSAYSAPASIGDSTWRTLGLGGASVGASSSTSGSTVPAASTPETTIRGAGPTSAGGGSGRRVEFEDARASESAGTGGANDDDGYSTGSPRSRNPSHPIPVMSSNTRSVGGISTTGEFGLTGSPEALPVRPPGNVADMGAASRTGRGTMEREEGEEEEEGGRTPPIRAPMTADAMRRAAADDAIAVVAGIHSRYPDADVGSAVSGSASLEDGDGDLGVLAGRAGGGVGVGASRSRRGDSERESERGRERGEPLISGRRGSTTPPIRAPGPLGGAAVPSSSHPHWTAGDWDMYLADADDPSHPQPDDEGRPLQRRLGRLRELERGLAQRDGVGFDLDDDYDFDIDERDGLGEDDEEEEEGEGEGEEGEGESILVIPSLGDRDVESEVHALLEMHGIASRLEGDGPGASAASSAGRRGGAARREADDISRDADAFGEADSMDGSIHGGGEHEDPNTGSTHGDYDYRPGGRRRRLGQGLGYVGQERFGGALQEEDEDIEEDVVVVDYHDTPLEDHMDVDVDVDHNEDLDDDDEAHTSSSSSSSTSSASPHSARSRRRHHAHSGFVTKPHGLGSGYGYGYGSAVFGYEDDLDLAGLCFDPSGERMYVAGRGGTGAGGEVMSGAVVEWGIRGAEKRWWVEEGWK